MARFEPIANWPGSVLYTAAHGRLYCAVPRGLIPEHPYTMAALRAPSPAEQQAWGPGVQPRMVVDVTDIPDLQRSIGSRNLPVAPWNTYLVLRLPDSRVVVAYRVAPTMPRLNEATAGQVAIASGHDVAGWAAEVTRHYGSEQWQFIPPRYDSLPGPVPTIAITGS